MHDHALSHREEEDGAIVAAVARAAAVVVPPEVRERTLAAVRQRHAELVQRRAARGLGWPEAAVTVAAIAFALTTVRVPQPTPEPPPLRTETKTRVPSNLVVLRQMVAAPPGGEWVALELQAAGKWDLERGRGEGERLRTERRLHAPRRAPRIKGVSDATVLPLTPQC